MSKKIEVLQSLMNIKNEEQYKEILKKNNIIGKVLTVNQVKMPKDIFNLKSEQKRLYSYNEKGASKSRNRLLELAEEDICIFADDDTIYTSNYEQIIQKAYQDNPEAESIIFFVENLNPNREKNKKIRNKKINILDAMRVRTYEISIKKETIEKMLKLNIKFDENFGPEGIFKKGEETVLISEMLKKKIKIYSVSEQIGIAKNDKSTWFTGYNKKFLYDQGAIFYEIAPKIHKALILLYIVRKFKLYKKNICIIEAYRQMKLGAKKCKEIYKGNGNG